MVVDLRLIYHGGGEITNFPVFYKGWEFFREFLSYPGGLVEYISAFLSQFFYIGWAGALVATVQAWLMWLCTGSIMRTVSGWRPRWVCFIPPILLLMLYARYSYQFSAAMTLLVALGFACLYVRTASKSKPVSLPASASSPLGETEGRWRDGLIFLVLSLIVYAAAGVVYLLFAVLCAIYELLIRKRWWAGLIYLLLVPIVLQIEGLLVFDVSIANILSHLRLLFHKPDTTMVTMVCILYLFLPVAVLGLRLARFFGVSPSGRPFFSGTATVSRVIALALPFVVGAVAAGLSHNSMLKTTLEIDYYACRRMWPEVLQAANRHPLRGFPSRVVNRALYHTGRLADDMFTYPQGPDALYAAHAINTYWMLFDTYIDIGQMNQAEYALIICMEMYGEKPIILKRLALVNIVKGRTGAAKACLGALSRTLFDAGWATEYLAKIESDPGLSTDEEVQHLRSIMAERDIAFQQIIDVTILQELLERNKRNRMAFEYFMASCLLTGNFDKFIANLNRLDDFDYIGIPRVYEEAMLFYTYKTKNNVELPGRKISDAAHQVFNGFVDVYIGRYKQDEKAALDELSNKYGDSYLYYCLYKQSGMKK
jgi:hypothetical protein